MRKVIIPLNAFDQNLVKEQGHAHFVHFIKEIDAQGIEIRKELLTPRDYPLSQLNQVIRENELYTVFSAPVELWGEDGKLNQEPLNEVVAEVHQLNAQILKLPLGHYQNGQSELSEVNEFINQIPEGTKLMIENDQTLHGGNIQYLKLFFESALKENVDVAMTFDIGNWVFTDEDVIEAADQLKPYVQYVHLKHVDKQGTKLVTLPMPLDKKNEILQLFPNHLPIAFEFPLELDHTAKRYVDYFSKDDQEAVTWSN
ncbi:xylose isomerase [Neobacillus sp. PS3-34]|uniref:sugar phosphate isomerase/epimerase family protein n=1 Tax=Neobacillus sp. PS3-34 TaxID=3070678 RepID=UPI0027E0BA28|nr:xylose isomerase [Neobacillus sp. PS3-34]WML49189.1 xylose isomerase [Neobacillus sp. PS3-34]